MDHKEARTQARALIEKLELKPQVSYAGQRESDGWKHDEWHVVLGTFRTTYKTGLGHRIYAKRTDLRPVLPFGTVPYRYYTAQDLGRAGTVHRANFDRSWLRPVFPDPVDIVCSLVQDGEAVDMSFVDWCGNYSANADSIKDRAAYDACCDIGQRLRQQIKHSDLEQLRELAREL